MLTNTFTAETTVNNYMKDDIDTTIENARLAQSSFCNWSDSDIDKIILQISEQVASREQEFANDTVAETGIGNAIHKAHKLRLVHNQVSSELIGKKTIGQITSLDCGVTEYASPRGTIFAVIPMTNPIPNSLFKILLALKTRNSLIVSYPRKATTVGSKLINLVQGILMLNNAPKNMVQVVSQPSSRAKVNCFMQHEAIDLILATGGAGLVKSAYSSGNPSFGVGPGNVPVLICPDANLNNAAESIVQSKAYDNGIICGSESNLIVDHTVLSEFSDKLKAHNAAILTAEEKSRSLRFWFDGNGSISEEALGKSPEVLAQLADIKRDYPIKVFIIPAYVEEYEILGKEKLAPVLSMFESTTEEGLNLAIQFLANDGAGHSAVIHTRDEDKIKTFAEKIPAGRILVNTPATFGMMGVSTKLNLSFMLGSGSWGGNITTEAITWRHLLNIKREARHAYDVAY